MKLNLQLVFFMVLVQVSLAMWKHVTVTKGQTVYLSCPISAAHNNKVEWKNPKGYVMFFREKKALKDKRYSIDKLSESEFTISISDVTFKDGGVYVCSEYGQHTTETKVQVTVLGFPKMSVTKEGRQILVKCTAEGNNQPPKIFWKLDDGPEFQGQAHESHLSSQDKKFTWISILRMISVKRRVTVKCLVRHPALHSHPLINFVKVGPGERFPLSTTTRPGTVKPAGSTEALSTHSSYRTIVNSTPTHVTVTLSEDSMRLSTSQATAPTGFPLKPDTSTHSALSPTDNSTSSLSTSRADGSISNTTSGWISDTNTTEEVHAGGNRTVNANGPNMQAGASQGSTFMVFLVSCLVVGLLVVVIFFAIKLRRAHTAWKRENEESNTSEESSKSKSNQEEKSTQQQRRRGLFNTAFTKYNEEPTATTTRKTSEHGVNTEQTSQPQPQPLGQTSARCDIKETEL